VLLTLNHSRHLPTTSWQQPVLPRSAHHLTLNQPDFDNYMPPGVATCWPSQPSRGTATSGYDACCPSVSAWGS